MKLTFEIGENGLVVRDDGTGRTVTFENEHMANLFIGSEYPDTKYEMLTLELVYYIDMKHHRWAWDAVISQSLGRVVPRCGEPMTSEERYEIARFLLENF